MNRLKRRLGQWSLVIALPLLMLSYTNMGPFSDFGGSYEIDYLVDLEIAVQSPNFQEMVSKLDEIQRAVTKLSLTLRQVDERLLELDELKRLLNIRLSGNQQAQLDQAYRQFQDFKNRLAQAEIQLRQLQLVVANPPIDFNVQEQIYSRYQAQYLNLVAEYQHFLAQVNEAKAQLEAQVAQIKNILRSTHTYLDALLQQLPSGTLMGLNHLVYSGKAGRQGDRRPCESQHFSSEPPLWKTDEGLSYECYRRNYTQYNQQQRITLGRALTETEFLQNPYFRAQNDLWKQQGNLFRFTLPSLGKNIGAIPIRYPIARALNGSFSAKIERVVAMNQSSFVRVRFSAPGFTMLDPRRTDTCYGVPCYKNYPYTAKIGDQKFKFDLTWPHLSVQKFEFVSTLLIRHHSLDDVSVQLVHLSVLPPTGATVTPFKIDNVRAVVTGGTVARWFLGNVVGAIMIAILPPGLNTLGTAALVGANALVLTPVFFRGAFDPIINYIVNDSGLVTIEGFGTPTNIQQAFLDGSLFLSDGLLAYVNLNKEIVARRASNNVNDAVTAFDSGVSTAQSQGQQVIYDSTNNDVFRDYTQQLLDQLRAYIKGKLRI